MMSEHLPNEGLSGDAAEEGLVTTGVEPFQGSLFCPQSLASVEDMRNAKTKGRLFLPTNREDALLLLGCLLISRDLPDPSTLLAVQDGMPVLLHDGLRRSEEELLQGGLVERFPLLIEVCPENDVVRPFVIGFDQIRHLIFRNQEDADAFRFRPVDEFDPVALSFRIEPSCFGMEGEARFEFKRGESSVNLRPGHLVDRLTCALYFTLLLGEQRPDCRRAIFDFLSGSVAGPEVSVPTFPAVCEALGDNLVRPADRQLHAVVHAFINSSMPAPNVLLDEIADRLATLGPIDDRTRDVESKWVAVARNVVRNRLPLNGELLADDGSVLLRGALLALKPEGVKEVSTYLDAEKPAGVRVVVFATFLIGLKIGVLNAPWAVKGGSAVGLAKLGKRLLSEVESGDVKQFANVITTRMDEAEQSDVLLVLNGPEQLASWQVPRVIVPDPIEGQWLDDFRAGGYRVVGSDQHRRIWAIEVAAGSIIQIRHCELGGRRFPMFCYRFDRGEKLRKPTQIGADFAAGGYLWSPRKDPEDGVLCLCCELHVLPNRNDFEWILAALEVAKGLCISQVKPVRRRAPRPRSKVVVD